MPRFYRQSAAGSAARNSISGDAPRDASPIDLQIILEVGIGAQVAENNATTDAGMILVR